MHCLCTISFCANSVTSKITLCKDVWVWSSYSIIPLYYIIKITIYKLYHRTQPRKSYRPPNGINLLCIGKWAAVTGEDGIYEFNRFTANSRDGKIDKLYAICAPILCAPILCVPHFVPPAYCASTLCALVLCANNLSPHTLQLKLFALILSVPHFAPYTLRHNTLHPCALHPTIYAFILSALTCAARILSARQRHVIKANCVAPMQKYLNTFVIFKTLI